MKQLFLFLALCAGSSCALGTWHDMGTTNLLRVPLAVQNILAEMTQGSAAGRHK